MSKKQAFIEYVEKLMSETNVFISDFSEEAALYWEALKGSNDKDEKPLFTDNGKLILNFLKDNQDTPLWKAKDIAENLLVSSRTVAGAMRKLVTDEYVEKVGKEPTIYSLTEKGKNIVID